MNSFLKKSLLAPVFAASFIAIPASADIIKCVFTEPFAATTYSMVQQTLTVQRPQRRPQVIRNVSFQIRGPARFQLMDRNNIVIQELNLNYAGSDGMSDNIYPYSGIYTPMKNDANHGIGGCSSNYLRPVIRD